MLQTISFFDFLLSLQQTVLNAAGQQAIAQQQQIDYYFEADRLQPKSVLIKTSENKNVKVIKVPLLAISSLTSLAVTSVAVKITLPLFVKDRRLWVYLDGASDCKRLEVDLNIDPHITIDVFLVNIAELERELLSRLEN